MVSLSNTRIAIRKMLGDSILRKVYLTFVISTVILTLPIQGMTAWFQHHASMTALVLSPKIEAGVGLLVTLLLFEKVLTRINTSARYYSLFSVIETMLVISIMFVALMYDAADIRLYALAVLRGFTSIQHTSAIQWWGYVFDSSGSKLATWEEYSLSTNIVTQIVGVINILLASVMLSLGWYDSPLLPWIFVSLMSVFNIVQTWITISVIYDIERTLK